jgi:hypothetical protein
MQRGMCACLGMPVGMASVHAFSTLISAHWVRKTHMERVLGTYAYICIHVCMCAPTETGSGGFECVHIEDRMELCASWGMYMYTHATCSVRARDGPRDDLVRV